MGDPKIAVELQIGTQPPLSTVRAFALFVRLARLESVMAADHLQNSRRPSPRCRLGE